jgi:hypothetical protein
MQQQQNETKCRQTRELKAAGQGNKEAMAMGC